MKISIGTLYRKVAILSPRVEVVLRTLYWNNVKRLSKFSINKTNRFHRTKYVDFNDIVAFLKNAGIGEGALVILHSSYGNLKPTSLDNKGIIDSLLSLVGESGTLAAPVIRSFPEEEVLTWEEQFNDAVENIECAYDVHKSKITSGVLAYTLMQHVGSYTSRFPLNPLTAVGPLAKDMMAHNLDGEAPSAHGPDSCWKFCADHDAFIVYLGINYEHHLTMQQVVTENYSQMRPEKFYRYRKFKIIDKEKIFYKTVAERRQKWTKNLAEINVAKDIKNSGIVNSIVIEDIPVSVIKAKDLISLYLSKGGTYPYYK